MIVPPVGIIRTGIVGGARVAINLDLLILVVHGLRARDRFLGASPKREKPSNERDQETVGEGKTTEAVHNRGKPYVLKSVDYFFIYEA